MTGEACGTAPILCAHLLRRVDEELIGLLRSLAPHEWNLQTIASAWKVRDVVSHLLDTALRKLSLARDSCYVEHKIAGPLSTRISQDRRNYRHRTAQASGSG